MQREFPAFDCWRAVSGLCYARPREARPGHPAPVMAEDPPGLRGEIIQHQARLRDAIVEESLVAIFGPPPTPGSS